MTKPQTPTGKRHAARADDPEQGYSAITSREIVAIEREAAAAERERLRDVWDGWQEYGMPPDVYRAMDSGDAPHVVWRLLTADPEATDD